MKALLQRLHASWSALGDHAGYTPAMVQLHKEVLAALNDEAVAAAPPKPTAWFRTVDGHRAGLSFDEQKPDLPGWAEHPLYSAMPPASGPAESWRPMETAPKDGTLLRLLVAFTEHPTEDSTEPAPTVGANSFGNTGVDEWLFAGWSWEHDCFTQGEGTPVGWLPFRATAPGDSPQAKPQELPPLPEPVVVGTWSGHTPNQMREYARAALAKQAVPAAAPGRYTEGYEAGMGSCIPRLNALLEENSRLKTALLDCNLARAAVPEPASPTAAPAQWLWRVFNLGWPRGHESGSGEWGAWSLVPAADAVRLAAEVDNKAYEFVPYVPTTPLTATETGEVRAAAPETAQLAELLRQECDDTDAAFLHALGLEPAAFRTEGGRLNLAKIRDAFTRPGIDGYVDNFMTWRLPDDFAPDGGVSFDGRTGDANGRPQQWPLGTNLLTESQARAMLEQVLRGPAEAAGPVAFKSVHPNGSWAVLVLDTAAWEKLPHGTKLWLSPRKT